MTVLNQNDNPVFSILFGISLDHSNKLVYLNAIGEMENTLVYERSFRIMNGYEWVSIYLDSPLLPGQNRTINVYQSFKDLVSYDLKFIEEEITQVINYTGYLFPILPYESRLNIKSLFNLQSGAVILHFDKVAGMGLEIGADNIIYDIEQSFLSFLDPFSEILGEQKQVLISFSHSETTRLEIEETKREIVLSPWGIIRIREDIVIHNTGLLNTISIPILLPSDVKNIKVFDNLGVLTNLELTEYSEDSTKKKLEINLIQERVVLSPFSRYVFSIEYNLPSENYFSYNWFQQSINIDILTTNYEYLVHKSSINVIIEGCNHIEFVSDKPEASLDRADAKVITYTIEDVGNLEQNVILLTYSIDLFSLLLRPILFTLLIAAISGAFVLIVKSRKKDKQISDYKEEYIPLNEIREYCSLYEEINALVVEIRTAEAQTKRKKITKKAYKNILDKNRAKIEQIQQEIIPFKKTLMETNDTFENIIKKLDVLDAERISVKDSLNLLETRYKRGRLPSRSAYQKLSDDFMKRQKKIDRTIDKFIQQLRSYLL